MAIINQQRLSQNRTKHRKERPNSRSIAANSGLLSAMLLTGYSTDGPVNQGGTRVGLWRKAAMWVSTKTVPSDLRFHRSIAFLMPVMQIGRQMLSSNLEICSQHALLPFWGGMFHNPFSLFEYRTCQYRVLMPRVLLRCNISIDTMTKTCDERRFQSDADEDSRYSATYCNGGLIQCYISFFFFLFFSTQIWVADVNSPHECPVLAWYRHLVTHVTVLCLFKRLGCTDGE